jgi:hypothetical protein
MTDRQPVTFEPARHRLCEGEVQIMPDGSWYKRTVPTLGSGTRVWCNVEYDPSGQCLGADAHWLSPGAADEAIVSYLEDYRVGAR